MNRLQQKNNFLDQINNSLNRENLMTYYYDNKITYEKFELYGDFVLSLLKLAFDTYMGDDITNVEQQIKHFNWCWNKNQANFVEEGLHFSNEELYEYFLEFMLEVFYMVNKTEIHDLDINILKLWENIFTFNKTKSVSELNALIEIYNIIDNSLKKIEK